MEKFDRLEKIDAELSKRAKPIILTSLDDALSYLKETGDLLQLRDALEAELLVEIEKQ